MRFLACVLLIWPTFAAGPFDSVRDSIRRETRERKVPSVAVAVARDGRIVWEEAFGLADIEGNLAATPDTPYSLASISKPITATALMTLVQAGRIQLERPVNDYLGAAKLTARVGDAADATLERVASHSAGLPLHFQFFYNNEPFRPPSPDETIRRFGNLVTAPGEVYQYSNLGYGILDTVIARVSEKSYPIYLREAVLEPLGMAHSGVGPPPGAAVRYGDGQPLPLYEFDHTGASGVYASARDLVRFGLFHDGVPQPGRKRILSPASIARMQKPVARIDGASGYGIGWRAYDTPEGYRQVSHGGGMPGVATVLRLIPSKRAVIVVLTNSATPLPHRIADEIEAVLVASKGIRDPGEHPAGPSAIPKELRGEWNGEVVTYKGSVPIRITIDDAGAKAGLGERSLTPMKGARMRDGFLTGVVSGDLGLEESRGRPVRLEVRLKPRGSELNGAITSFGEGSAGKLPAGAVTQWVRLRRPVP